MERIGGCFSSMSRSKEDLVTPLDTLYDELFSDAEFIQPNI